MQRRGARAIEKCAQLVKTRLLAHSCSSQPIAKSIRFVDQPISRFAALQPGRPRRETARSRCVVDPAENRIAHSCRPRPRPPAAFRQKCRQTSCLRASAGESRVAIELGDSGKLVGRERDDVPLPGGILGVRWIADAASRASKLAVARRLAPRRSARRRNGCGRCTQQRRCRPVTTLRQAIIGRPLSARSSAPKCLRIRSPFLVVLFPLAAAANLMPRHSSGKLIVSGSHLRS